MSSTVAIKISNQRAELSSMFKAFCQIALPTNKTDKIRIMMTWTLGKCLNLVMLNLYNIKPINGINKVGEHLAKARRKLISFGFSTGTI